jgi:hypothetical protein
MSSAARSVFFFGIYLIVLGATLLIAPNLLLGIFGMPPTSEVWIRIVNRRDARGISWYPPQAARGELLAYFWWTVYLRLSVIGFFAVFVALGMAPAGLMLFAGIDVLGALWTCVACDRSARPERLMV